MTTESIGDVRIGFIEPGDSADLLQHSSFSRTLPFPFLQRPYDPRDHPALKPELGIYLNKYSKLWKMDPRINARFENAYATIVNNL